MDLTRILPVMIYDDRCYLCAKFAKIVSFFARKKILIVGHYTDFGMKIKSEIFSNNYDSTKMFWFVSDKIAYGGRAALLPLISSLFKSEIKPSIQYEFPVSCDVDCKAPKAVFLRTLSLFSNSEKITINKV
ncbi:MAG TPA: hypothetical protein VK431_03745 [Nitrosopumilaceae archaeon]|nr:hypothetical protein [Nitrosopumilaceae archaeon]